jgi:hypothetical protein
MNKRNVKPACPAGSVKCVKTWPKRHFANNMFSLPVWRKIQRSKCILPCPLYISKHTRGYPFYHRHNLFNQTRNPDQYANPENHDPGRSVKFSNTASWLAGPLDINPTLTALSHGGIKLPLTGVWFNFLNCFPSRL